MDLILESVEGVAGAACLLPNAKAGSLMVADLLTGSAGAYSGSLATSPLEAFVPAGAFPLMNFYISGRRRVSHFPQMSIPIANVDTCLDPDSILIRIRFLYIVLFRVGDHQFDIRFEVIHGGILHLVNFGLNSWQ
jgi:hypothetical protein